MGTWSVDGSQRIDLDALDEVQLEITGGEASVTVGAPAHLDVERLAGHPVEVSCQSGILRVVHRQRRLVRFSPDSERCSLRLVVPPGVRASVSAVGATVVVSGLEAAVSIRTVNGGVYLDDIGGDLDLKTVSGNIEATALRGAVRARTVSGDLTANEVRCPSVFGHSVSGDMVLDSVAPITGAYCFTTVSGEVVLRVPPDPVADVKLRSVSGRVASSLDLRSGPEHGSWSSRQRSGSSGSGAARIDVKTVSGRVALLERAEPA